MSRSPSITDPPVDAFAITPDDLNDLDREITAIAFGSAGSLRVTTVAGNVVNFPAATLAAGVQHVLRITRVHATGTTASDIVGFTYLES